MQTRNFLVRTSQLYSSQCINLKSNTQNESFRNYKAFSVYCLIELFKCASVTLSKPEVCLDNHKVLIKQTGSQKWPHPLLTSRPSYSSSSWWTAAFSRWNRDSKHLVSLLQVAYLLIFPLQSQYHNNCRWQHANACKRHLSMADLLRWMTQEVQNQGLDKLTTLMDAWCIYPSLNIICNTKTTLETGFPSAPNSCTS